jgi:hypothetical protein
MADELFLWHAVCWRHLPELRTLRAATRATMTVLQFPTRHRQDDEAEKAARGVTRGLLIMAAFWFVVAVALVAVLVA